MVFLFIDSGYSMGMNKLQHLTADLIQTLGLKLILTNDDARKSKSCLIATMILSSPLFIVAANEWVPAYGLTRVVRRETTNVSQVFARLQLTRASTCYRLLDSLVSMPKEGEPILVLEFLHTFYDADIPLRVRFFKLRECCRHLTYLARYRPIIVMAHEMQTEDYEKFIPALRSIANKTIYLEPELEQDIQPELF
jgi:hypothetical protein